ncbi:MAG: lysylphosphatidylglycerol synthase transmembrane domain-containing protein [Flavobacteriales bacterium]
MRGRFLRIGKYLLFFLIGVGLLYLAFRGAEIQKMWTILKDAHYSWIILTMALGFLTFISRGYRWLILLETMGYKAKASNSVNAVTIGYLVNLALPRLGEFTRCTALNRVERIPIGKLFGTIIVERAIDMIILFLLLILTLLTNLDTFGPFFIDVFGTKVQRTSNLIGYGFLFLVLGAVSLYLIYSYRKKLMRNKFFFKAFSLYRSVGHGVRTIYSMERKGLFFLHTVFIWTMYFFMTYLCFFSFDATANYGPDKGLFVMTAGGMGMAAPTQGGIGAYHWMVKESLKVLNVEGGNDMGLAFATVVHSSQVLMILITGGIALFLWYRAVRRKGKAEGLDPLSQDLPV